MGMCEGKETMSDPPFIREQKDGCLLLSVPLKEESYKEEMLQKNRIAGIVPVKMQAFNEHIQYRYETGSSLTLAEQFSRISPGTAEISTLMRQIEDTGIILESYLLAQEDMLLSLQDIYFDGKEYSFLYLPDYGKDIREQLAGLFEELMSCLNYEDRASVSLVYLLHARIRQKGSGIFSLRKLCGEILEAQKEEEQSYLERKDFHEILTPRPEERNKKTTEGRYLPEDGLVPENKKGRISENIRKLLKRNGKFLKRDGRLLKRNENCPDGKRKESKSPKNESTYRKVMQWLLDTLRKGPANSSDASCAAEKYYRSSGQTKGFTDKPDDEAAGVYSGGNEISGTAGALAMDGIDTMPLEPSPEFLDDTVLLCAPGDTVLLNGKERSYALEPMDGGRAKIVLTGYPFELGKEKKGTGYFGCLQDSVISRRHARLVRQGGRHYVMDLNSLNGTTVNGERLTPKVHKELKPGDMLGLAEIYYIFTCLEQQDDV